MDLNLLPVVRVLLEEQSVSRAAVRLNLSAPATSRALDRARRMFGDPLLVRSGRGVVITPRAQSLLDELRATLDQIATIIDMPNVLQPERIRRTFTIRANEAVIAAAGSRLISIIGNEAPNAEVRFELESADDIGALRRGDVDLAIGSYSDVTGDIEQTELVQEHLVAVVRNNHPIIERRSRPNIKRFAQLEHIVVSRKARRKNELDGLLNQRGLTRRTIAVVPSFGVALSMVAHSDATTFAPSRLASMYLDCGLLVSFVSPIPTPSVTVSQLWHSSNTSDPTHTWLRFCVANAAKTM
jgi:DNA-binding transcriptional LysR family regulator